MVNIHRLPPCAAPTFLTKLWQILDEGHKEVISWDKAGVGFVIVDSKRLAQDILCKHFKHAKYASFQRQLNYFGFKKVGQIYMNEFFRRDQPGLMLQIQRRKKISRALSATENTPYSNDHIQPEQQSFNSIESLYKNAHWGNTSCMKDSLCKDKKQNRAGISTSRTQVHCHFSNGDCCKASEKQHRPQHTHKALGLKRERSCDGDPSTAAAAASNSGSADSTNGVYNKGNRTSRGNSLDVSLETVVDDDFGFELAAALEDAFMMSVPSETSSSPSNNNNSTHEDEHSTCEQPSAKLPSAQEPEFKKLKYGALAQPQSHKRCCSRRSSGSSSCSDHSDATIHISSEVSSPETLSPPLSPPASPLPSDFEGSNISPACGQTGNCGIPCYPDTPWGGEEAGAYHDTETFKHVDTQPLDWSILNKLRFQPQPDHIRNRPT